MSKNVISLNDKVDKEQELGTLIVVILKARNLNDKHSFRKQDAYATATLNGTERRTEVEYKAGQHPVWDTEVRFSVSKHSAAKYRTLEVACYAKEPRADEILGKGVVDISETIRTGEFDDWVQLDIDGVKRGELYLEMTYYDKGPAPPNHSPKPAHAPNNKVLANVLGTDLQRRPSKLKPSERLSRPEQYGQLPAPNSLHPGPGPGPSKLQQQSAHGSYSPPKQQQHQPQQSGSVGGFPANLTPSYPAGGPNISPKRKNDPLPPAPNEPPASLPSLLRPGPGGGGGGRTPPKSNPIPISGNQPQQQQQGYGRHPSASPPKQPTYAPYGGSPPRDTAPNPYIGNGGGSGSGTSSPGSHTPNYNQNQNQNPYTFASQGGSPPQNGPPLIWRDGGPRSPVIDPGVQGAGGFAFPLPNAGPAQPNIRDSYESYGDNGGYPPLGGGRGRGGYGYPQSQNTASSRPPQGRDEHRDWDVDPNRLARYQSPLPLPPDAPSSSSSRPAPSTAQAPAPSGTAQLAPATSPPKASTPLPDNSRLDALRRAEEDAKRRHEQEMKDLELALQLDRELNAAEEEAARTRNAGNTNSRTAAMPGGWGR